MRPVLITLVLFAIGCANDVLGAPMCTCTEDACFAEECEAGDQACERPDGTFCVNYTAPCADADGTPSCTARRDGATVTIEGAVVCVSRDAWPGEHQPCE